MDKLTYLTTKTSATEKKNQNKKNINFKPVLYSRLFEKCKLLDPDFSHIR